MIIILVNYIIEAIIIVRIKKIYINKAKTKYYIKIKNNN